MVEALDGACAGGSCSPGPRDVLRTSKQRLRSGPGKLFFRAQLDITMWTKLVQIERVREDREIRLTVSCGGRTNPIGCSIRNVGNVPQLSW